MEIRTVQPGDPAWDEYVARHPEGSIFHGSGWTRSVIEAYRHPAVLLSAQVDGTTKGVLPLFHVKSLLFGSRLVSTAFGVYGGVLADDDRVAASLARAAQDVARDRDARYVEIRSRHARLADLPVKDLYYTFRIPIAGSVDATLKDLSKKMRQDLRRAENKGFEFVEGVDLKVFYRLYLHTLRWHGTPPFPFRWFEALQRNLGERCVMLGARWEGRWVGASMLFRDRDALMPYYTGVPRENYKLRTTVALHARMVRMAVESGASILDLGRSKRGTGAFDAKTHWGVEPEPLGYQYLMRDGASLPDLSPANPKFQPLIAMWRRLPIPATRLFGPPLNAALA